MYIEGVTKENNLIITGEIPEGLNWHRKLGVFHSGEAKIVRKDMSSEALRLNGLTDKDIVMIPAEQVGLKSRAWDGSYEGTFILCSKPHDFSKLTAIVKGEF